MKTLPPCDHDECPPTNCKAVRSGGWLAELEAAHALVEELLNTAGPNRHQDTRDLLRCAELDLHVALRDERRRSANEPGSATETAGEKR